MSRGVAVVGMMVALALLLWWPDRTRLLRHPPAEGEAAGLVLKANQDYSIRFPAPAVAVTAVGLYLRPLTTRLPAATILAEATVHGSKVGEGSASSLFIDQQRATHVRFQQPLRAESGDEVTVTLKVPPELDSLVRWQWQTTDTGGDEKQYFFVGQNQVPGALAWELQGKARPLFIQYSAILLLIVAVIFLFLRRGAARLIEEVRHFLKTSALGATLVITVLGVAAGSAVIGERIMGLRFFTLSLDDPARYFGTISLALALLGVLVGWRYYRTFVAHVSVLVVVAVLTKFIPTLVPLLWLTTTGLVAVMAGIGLGRLTRFWGDSHLARAGTQGVVVLAILEQVYRLTGLVEEMLRTLS